MAGTVLKSEYSSSFGYEMSMRQIRHLPLINNSLSLQREEKKEAGIFHVEVSLENKRLPPVSLPGNDELTEARIHLL